MKRRDIFLQKTKPPRSLYLDSKSEYSRIVASATITFNEDNYEADR
jgi:hypothetical protein